MSLEAIAAGIITNIVNTSTKILGDRVTEYNRGLVEKKGAAKPEIVGSIPAKASDLQLKLEKHCDQVRTWSSADRFADLQGAKSISQIYVNLDTYLTPTRLHLSGKERNKKEPLIKSVNNASGHVIILGQVGAGKTTSVKRLCSSFFAKDKSLGMRQRLPLLVRLRELPEHPIWPSLPIISALHQTISLPVQMRIPSSSVATIPEDWSRDTILEIYTNVLEALSPLIILDGFDEIPSIEAREVLVDELKMLCRTLHSAKIVLTSRASDFDRQIDNADTFEIAPLSLEQIEEFSKKWHADQVKAEHFIAEIKRSPYMDAAIKPLTLAHLCAIYERIGEIPEKPKTVYKKIVQLLIEEWDQQRNIRRTSIYSKFASDRKFDFLCNLAYNLTAQRKITVFDASQLRMAYSAICNNFGLPPEDAETVANELESHTGLFIEASYKGYEFVHKSVQEYLTAEHLVRMPQITIPGSQFSTLASELAVATAISSSASMYFSMILERAAKAGVLDTFLKPYAARLLQERPDFQESPEAFFLCISAMQKMEEDVNALTLAATILKATSESSIKFHYQAYPKPGESTLYKLIRPHQHVTLPGEMHIQPALMAKLREIAATL